MGPADVALGHVNNYRTAENGARCGAMVTRRVDMCAGHVASCCRKHRSRECLRGAMDGVINLACS